MPNRLDIGCDLIIFVGRAKVDARVGSGGSTLLQGRRASFFRFLNVPTGTVIFDLNLQRICNPKIFKPI